MDDEGLRFAGVISGSRLLLEGSFIDSNELVDIVIDSTASDADHSSGTLTINTTDGCQKTGDITETKAYALTVGVNGQGSAAADTDPSLQNYYPSGSVVNLTATPGTGYVFDHWEGNVADTSAASTSIAMTADQTVTAYFVQAGAEYTLTIIASGQGTVTLDPASGLYSAGTTVTLTTSPDAGWAFVRWIGDVADTSTATTTIFMAEPETVTAEFVDITSDSDSDGVPEYLENGPGGNDPDYDGNNDGIADSAQGHVTSCPTADGLQYATLAVADSYDLANVAAVNNPSPDDAPADVSFAWGFFQFTVTGLTPGDPVDVQIHLPTGSTPESYYKYGPTAVDASSHWYAFEYDAGSGVGAEYTANVITLHLKDGADGDDDLVQNGQITDVGAPGTVSTTPGNVNPGGGGGGGGGGCFIQALQ